MGVFIRVGNFFNQEILGTQSNLPWSVFFGSPQELYAYMPAHPVQIYEAAMYLCTFLLLFVLDKKPHIAGWTSGMLLTIVFTFRFFIETIKHAQTASITNILSMGQVLSIPFVIFGVWLLFFRKKSCTM